jgi:molecular chaperone GrpE
MRSSDEDSQGPVIHDRRRVDPVTGQVRESGRPADQAHGQPQGGPAQPRPGRHAVSKPGGGAAAGGAASGEYPAGGPPASGGQRSGPAAGAAAEPAAARNGPGGEADLTARLGERTADLQRLQAEYANYRKRVERDRIAVREQALANVLSELLPVLDDIGRAREHGELAGGFKSVAESLESAVAKLGLASYGEDGEPFDPNLHEALMHSYSSDVTEPTCVRILQPGYKVAERILRPARVAVAEPGEQEPAEPDGTAGAGDHVAAGGPDAPGSSPGSSEEGPGSGGTGAPGSGGTGAPGSGAPGAGGID